MQRLLGLWSVHCTISKPHAATWAYAIRPYARIRIFAPFALFAVNFRFRIPDSYGCTLSKNQSVGSSRPMPLAMASL